MDYVYIVQDLKSGHRIEDCLLSFLACGPPI